MQRLLKKQARLDDNKLRTLLGFLTPEGFQKVLLSRKLLESMGVVGKRDY